MTKEDVTWNKKSLIKMFKTALFDCAINEKCCSVDGGRGICPLFSSPPRGIWQLKSPHPREFAIQGKKNANARGWARGGALGAAVIDWCIMILFISLRVLHSIPLINPLVLSFLQFFTHPLDRSITYFFHSFILQYVRSSVLSLVYSLLPFLRLNVIQ